MHDRRNQYLTRQDKLAFVKMLALAVAVTFMIGVFWTSPARSADMEGWEGWPKQSRAERLGTFTYVFGSAGFVTHDETTEGKAAYRGYAPDGNDGTRLTNAEGDGDDIYVAGGFGVRFPHDWHFEVGLGILNGAYDQPTASGGSDPKPDQPVFEMSVLKGFKLGGPPLLRYTARVGFASIDDPNTDDSTFFGLGIAHNPFRIELRQYDFDIFESQVLSVSYIYDF